MNGTSITFGMETIGDTHMGYLTSIVSSSIPFPPVVSTAYFSSSKSSGNIPGMSAPFSFFSSGNPTVTIAPTGVSAPQLLSFQFGQYSVPLDSSLFGSTTVQPSNIPMGSVPSGGGRK